MAPLDLIDIRLLSDFYGAIDCGQITLLALFDVSAAFDSVDHKFFLTAFLFPLA